MNTSLLTSSFTASSPSTRRVIEFQSSEGKIGIEIRYSPWEWPRISHFLDEVLPLTTIGSTTVPIVDNQILTKIIYPYLPNGKGELREIRDNAKKWYQLAHWGGTSAAKQVLKPYIRQLRALVWAVSQKLAVLMCMPNQQNWDKRAYQLFLELQNNLGRLKRIHFLTVTFKGNPIYGVIKERMRRLRRKLRDNGFESLPVVSQHPSVQFKGRMHGHLLVWSKRERSASDEKAAVKKCRDYLKSHKSPFGMTKWQPIANRQSFLKVMAYMAWNYDETIKSAKGGLGSIPKRARVLTRPKEVVCGKKWERAEKVSPVTPATVSWQKAVVRYATAYGHSLTGDRRWIWRERRLIRKFLKPEAWWVPTVTGLDGNTYKVTAAGLDHEGEEIYLVSSEERGGFYLTEHGLGELAKLQAAPGAFEKKQMLDLTTGKTANWYEVHGMHAFIEKDSCFGRRIASRSGLN